MLSFVSRGVWNTTISQIFRRDIVQINNDRESVASSSKSSKISFDIKYLPMINCVWILLFIFFSIIPQSFLQPKQYYAITKTRNSYHRRSLRMFFWGFWGDLAIINYWDLWESHWQDLTEPTRWIYTSILRIVIYSSVCSCRITYIHPHMAWIWLCIDRCIRLQSEQR